MWLQELKEPLITESSWRTEIWAGLEGSWRLRNMEKRPAFYQEKGSSWAKSICVGFMEQGGPLWRLLWCLKWAERGSWEMPLGRYKKPLFLKVGSKHYCHCHLLEHGRNPESQALGQTHEVRIWILTKFPMWFVSMLQFQKDCLKKVGVLLSFSFF